MTSHRNVVFQDKKITEMLGSGRSSDAHDLFEYNRISGENRDAFVAALIGRLCVLETRQKQQQVSA